jgi:hypothetical protein
MAGSKKKKLKGKPHPKAATKRATSKKSPKKSPKPSKQAASAKKVAAKKKVPARKPQRAASSPGPPRPSKGFAEKVRNCDAGTGIWFITAGSVEHAVIQRRGNDGPVVIRTDAGVTEAVSASNLFETADKARAARY